MSLGNAITNTAAAIVAQFSGTPVDYLATALMQTALANEDARHAAQDRAWAAYLGDFPAPFAHRKNTPAGQDCVRVNRTAPIVDAATQFLFGTPPTYALPAPPVDPRLPTPPPDAALLDTAAWLTAVQRVNRWDAMLLDWATNGGVCGHAYLRLVPPAAPVVPGMACDWAGMDATALPQVHPLDPMTLQIQTDPRNTTQTTGYIWTWRQGTVGVGGTVRAARQLIEPHPAHAGWWLITDQESGVLNRWTTLAQTDWPFPFPPIVDCKNLPNPNAVYGLPDVTDSIIEINKAVNFTLSNTLRVYRLHGSPKLALFGVNPGDTLDTAPDVAWQFQAVDARVEQYTPTINPAVGESLTHALDASIQQESRTPGLILGQIGAGMLPPSGVALRTELWPLLMKTATKRTSYGPALEEVWRRLMLISRRAPAPVTVVWPELLPADPLPQRQAFAIDVGTLGVSQRSVQEKLGYDPTVEAAQRAAESTDVGGAANPTGALPLEPDADEGPGGSPPGPEEAQTPAAPKTGKN